MGERRKRKSLWDMEEETKHFSGMNEHNSWAGKEHHSSHDSGRYHEFSASRNYTTNSREYSGQPSWKSNEENPVAPLNGSFIKNRQNAPEGKEIGGGNRYYQNMSPGFDGMERRKYNHSLENDRSHSRRARSRSRSRSRTRGRSRSRSLSKGGGRERERGRSRSRSRSRSDGGARDQARSRSPIADYRHQSHGWSDRKSDKSAQICRDFAAGRCRRGSQCRFSHPKNISRGDGDLVGDDTAENWRNRTDHGHISKHSYSRDSVSDLRADVSDPYYGENEQFHNKSRSPVPCNDFMKGKCRWGDTCRFSHHFASDETFGKGTRYTSFDKDIEHQPSKNGKLLCKFFAAGKCDRDNCRFSHEDPKFNSLEGRQGEVSDDNSLHDKSNKRNGPTWNDATRISDNVKPAGWSESIVTITNSTGDTTDATNHNRWGHSLENENISWGMPEWTDNSINRGKQPSLPGESGSYAGDVGPAESIGKENMANKQEDRILHGSQLHNQDGNSNVQGQNTFQEDQNFSMKAWQQNVSPVSHIQQKDHGEVENNLVSSFRSDVLDEVKDSRNTTHPIFFSGQNLNQNGENLFPGHSSISNETDEQNMPNPSNGFSGDLSGPETHLVGCLNLQSQIQNHQKAVQMTGMLETKVSQIFPDLLTSEHSAKFTNTLVSIAGQEVAPVKNPTVFPNKRFENEQSRQNAETEVSNSRGMAPSFSDTPGHVPLVKTTNVQSNPVRVSCDSINPMENGRGTNEHGNHTEQDNHIQVGRSSPLSIVGTEPDNSKVDHSGSPKLKQETILANSEVNEGNRAIGEESKGVQNNKHSETLDGHGKVEESIANKDDKGMRIFKNSLIEFVKDILKPTWKEGRMSREVHKTIVKKVVDKVTSTIQVDHIPKTQDKVEQYLSYSKPKIAKLVQAYVGRCLKTES